MVAAAGSIPASLSLAGLGRGVRVPLPGTNQLLFRGEGPEVAGVAPRWLSAPTRERSAETSVQSDGLPVEATEGGGAAAPLPLVEPSGPLAQPQLSLRLVSLQDAAARSVAADATARMATTQAGLRTTQLNLRDAPATDLLLTSSRDLRLAARSLEQGVSLVSQGGNSAVISSAIEGGAALGSYQLAADEALSLVFGSAGQGQRPQLDVRERVSVLENSLLRDSGGGDPIRIEARLAVSLQSPTGMPSPEGVLAVEAAALRDSSIQLGDQGSVLSIGSRLQLSGLPDATATSKDPERPEQPLQLVGGAVGLAHSRLQTGSGDDTVTIRAVIDPGDPGSMRAAGRGSLDALALDHSVLQLGGGHDRLVLEGAVRQSRIETGSGTTAWQAAGAIEASVLQLASGSRVEAELGDQAADLEVVGDGALFLRAGGASDRLRLDGALQGWVVGGGGDDQLVVEARERDLATTSGKATDRPLLLLEKPGQGVLAALRFQEMEELVLPTRASTVWVAPDGGLAGGLRTAAGSRLDYSAWSEGVRIDLRQGRATAFAAEEAGGVEGVEEVRGGEGPDLLVGGSTTARLEGGGGADRIEFSDWFGQGARPGMTLVGGAGNDLFVLPRLVRPGTSTISSSSATSSSGLGARASLLDLELLDRALLAPEPLAPEPLVLEPTLLDPPPISALPSDRLSLSDRLALWQPSALQPGGEELVVLQPSGVEGLGDPRLLPLAPLSQLLAGMGDLAPQLAIATGSGGSELVRLDSGSTFQSLLDLPALRMNPERANVPGLRWDAASMALG